MSFLLSILALLSHLQNLALVQEIELCVLTNRTLPTVWACILAKIQAANLPPGSPDHAIAAAAQAMASSAGL